MIIGILVIYLNSKLDFYRIGPECEIVRISEPIKRFWAEKNQLDLTELLSDGAYKENHRKAMIEWSDEQRAKDYGIFCRDAMMRTSRKPICIVSDIRRRNDIRFFRETYGDKLVLVRIKCEDSCRSSRGWTFATGVDDIPSECDLDEFTEWDHVLVNDGSVTGEDLLRPLVERVKSVTQL